MSRRTSKGRRAEWWKRDSEYHLHRAAKVAAAITRALGPWKPGGAESSGEMLCPVCRIQILTYTRSALAPQIEARCRQIGCFAGVRIVGD